LDRRTFGKLAGLAAVGAWIDAQTAGAQEADFTEKSEAASVHGNSSKSKQPQAAYDCHYVEKMPPARHPQLVYWFWHNDTLAGKQYLRSVENMATESSFSLAIMTARTGFDPPGAGVDFYDFDKMHGPFAETVRAAHQRNLKIGMQVWELGALTRANDPTAKALPCLPVAQSLALITEGEAVLDANGHADYSVVSTEARDRQPFHSELVKVWAFRKTAEGYYAETSLADITDSARTMKADAASVTLSIDAPVTFAGCTAYVLVSHYYDYPDLFNAVMSDNFRNVLEHYSDIPLDGTALDEFGYMMLNPKRVKPFRDRLYGHAFAAEYAGRTGAGLERALFDMRYAPDGKPEVRIRAINWYFDVMRDGPLRVERAFYNMSKEIFGPNTFAGIHNTYHNTMRSDDLWRVGFNWWSVPREYGQSDENWPMPQRMGLIVAHSEPVSFDQKYGGNLDFFLEQAFRESRFGGRTHYLAWNDTRLGRINMAGTVPSGKDAAIGEVEQKIRLLNHFDPPAPKLPVLVVFGMPALIDWFPDYDARNDWDINGKLGIEQKALAVWAAGYPCALLPSDFIDSGQITYNGEGHPIINGHVFDCMVFLYPQYAKETTLKFLDRFTRHGGKLMLEGDATHNFDGHDIKGRFEEIAARATVRGFDVNQIARLGAQVNSLDSGALMEDGSTIFTDFTSWQTKQPKPFTVKMAGHEFSSSYVGVCALKVDAAGDVEKFACGGFSKLLRDGKEILSLERPADVVITRTGSGNFHVTVVGSGATLTTRKDVASSAF
jgi:hypothetical protein